MTTPSGEEKVKATVRNWAAEWVVGPAALAFLWSEFGWRAAVAWLLIQTYANLKAPPQPRKDEPREP